MTLERPFVILNVAVTADGKTDTVARRGAKISSPQDLARVDRLRAESDAIMVGGRTLLGDDPRLTVKSAELRAARRARGLTENPLKVGVVSKATLRLDSRFLTVGPASVLLFTTQQTDPAQIARLRQAGADVHVLGETRVDARRPAHGSGFLRHDGTAQNVARFRLCSDHRHGRGGGLFLCLAVRAGGEGQNGDEDQGKAQVAHGRMFSRA